MIYILDDDGYLMCSLDEWALGGVPTRRRYTRVAPTGNRFVDGAWVTDVDCRGSWWSPVTNDQVTISDRGVLPPEGFEPGQAPHVPTLAEASGLAVSEIDRAAGSARRRYITDESGQAETYIRKESQAREWVASGYSGNPPSFISAEASALGLPPQLLALQVLQMADFWVNIKGPEIEAARRKWKVAVMAAQDVESVNVARDLGLAALAQL